MALLDAFKNMNIFGARTPSYLEGVVDPEKLKQAQQQSLVQGLLGTAVGYLAQPKNQNYGSAVPYLAKGFMQGMQQAQSPYQNLERDLLMKQKFDEMKRAETKRKDLERLRGDIYKMKDVTTQVPTNQYDAIVKPGADGTTQIAPNMNFVQQTENKVTQEPVYNEAAMNELQIKYPEAYAQIIQNRKAQAEVAKLEAEAAAKGGTDLNISKLNPKDFTRESWIEYSTPNSPFYGDTRILDGVTPEVQAKLAETNAKIKWEYGVDSGIVKQPKVNEITNKDVKEGNRSLVTLPYSNEEVVPQIIDLGLSGKAREKLKIEQPLKQKGLRQSAEALRNERKKIRDVINSGALSKISGVQGVFPSIPGGEAANAEALLENIKNNEFLNNYRSVKETGGGFGSLTEKEGERLESLRTSLSKAQSPEQLEAILVELDDILAKQELSDYEGYMSVYGEYNYNPKVLPDFTTKYQGATDTDLTSGFQQTNTMNEADKIIGL